MPHAMYHRVPCSQKLAAVPTNQDLPEYRTNWPRVRWCVGVVWCRVSTQGLVTASRQQRSRVRRSTEPRRCSTTRHTFNLSAVIGEIAAIATQGHDSGLHTGYRASFRGVRRLFSLRGRRSFGHPRAPLVLPVGIPPGTDSTPNPLGIQPLPGSLGDLAQNRAHPRAHPADDQNQGSRVRGAYRSDCR
jgi:hypothetical protein